MEVIDWRTPRGIARLGCILLLVTSLGTIDAAAQEAPDSTDALTVDQAVQLALANNRNLKIVSLSLDSSKQKLLADKTKRLPAFNTYVFGSQLLEPISFTVQAGQFGTLSRHRPHSRHQHQHHDSQPADRLHLCHRRSTSSHALQDQPIHSRTGIVGRAGHTKGTRGANLYR